MSRPVSINPAPLVAVSGAAALAVIGLQYLIATPEEDALREFLVATALIVIAAALVFGVIVPRAVARGGSPATALTLSLLGLLLAAAYWSGIPPVLALGGVVIARRSAPGGVTTAATAVGVLALVADLASVIADGIWG